MPQAIVQITLDTVPLLKELKKRLKGLSDFTPAMAEIGEMGVASIQRNFEEQGRPEKWKDLAESTKAQRLKSGTWPGMILVRDGNLNRVSYEPSRNKTTILSANTPYAVIQHFGGQAGRNKKVTIPARPYMLLQSEDEVEILAILQQHVMEKGE